jgi:Putative DNA-binding domain
MDTTINNQPLIYYVIQGTSIKPNGSVFNEKFVHDNPLIARKKAFDFFEYNIQLVKLQQKEAVSFKIKANYILDDSNVFMVSKTKQNTENRGVGLYLVINNTTILNDKTVQTEERFLLHVETTTTIEIIAEMKNALVREFGLYQYLNIETTFKERVIKICLNVEIEFLPDEKEVLKTPFDFKTADFNTSAINLFNRKIIYVLKTVFHRNTSFINVLDWHNIRTHVSSFLNTGNGYIFLGNIKNTNTISSVFEGKSLSEIATILDENISNYFPMHQNYFSFEFITINNALIVVIMFKTFVTPCFYDNETNNNFYYRDRNGINSMNKTSRIVSYLNMQNSRYSNSIQNIVNNL